MTGPELLDSPRVSSDFEAADEMAQWAVDNAELLATLRGPTPRKTPLQEGASVHSSDSVNGQNRDSVN